MTKDFDNPVNREDTWSTRWDLYEDKDIIPLWVADMDFKSPKIVQDAFQKRINHGIYGYTEIPDELNNEIISLYKKRNWAIEKDWIVWLPGLETAIHQIYQLIMDTQSVIIPKPIYPPFLNAAKYSSKKIIFHDLKEVDGRLVYDIEKLSIEAEDNSWLMFLNPHNPGGTIFSKEELSDLAELVIKKNIHIFSDEIHSDFILEPDDKHMNIAKLEGMKERVITLDSLSKTFNIAGLNCAYAIIPNSSLRRQFQNLFRGQIPPPNLFGLIATLVCLQDGDSWKADLMQYLKTNKDFLIREFKNRKDVHFIEPRGTYLFWFKVLNTDCDDLKKHFEAFGVGLSNGKDFGKPGWMRLNFGTNLELLSKAVKRMHQALDALT